MGRLLTGILLLVGVFAVQAGVLLVQKMPETPPPGGVPESDGEEYRCTDLGANCICSEPMDNNDSPAPGGYNPSDSTGDKECTDVNGGWYDANWIKTTQDRHTTATATGVRAFPTGSTVSRHLRIEEGGVPGEIVLWLRGQDDMPSNVRRACQRQYLQVATNYTSASYEGNGCATERNKVFEVQWDNGGGFAQIQEGLNNSCTEYRSFNLAYSFGVSGNFYTPSGIDWDVCMEGTGWCRFEMCVGGNVEAGTDVYVEAQIKVLSTGNTYTLGPTATSSSVGGPLTNFAGDLYHGQGAGTHDGDLNISHFMQASWTTDSGQWIGASYEVEGITP